MHSCVIQRAAYMCDECRQPKAARAHTALWQWDQNNSRLDFISEQCIYPAWNSMESAFYNLAIFMKSVNAFLSRTGDAAVLSLLVTRKEEMVWHVIISGCHSGSDLETAMFKTECMRKLSSRIPLTPWDGLWFIQRSSGQDPMGGSSEGQRSSGNPAAGL